MRVRVKVRVRARVRVRVRVRVWDARRGGGHPLDELAVHAVADLAVHAHLG